MTLPFPRLPRTYANADDAFRRIGDAVNWLLNNLSVGADTGVITYGADITDDAGDGTPEGDLNATDFSGHPYATGTALRIETNAIVTFGHRVIAYIWEGPSGVTVGLGGSHTAVSTDLVPIGTANHAILVNRDQADQHPQSAVTSLVTDQQTQDNRLTTLEQHPPRVDNPHAVTHDQLVGQSPEPDPHPVYAKKLPAMLLGGTANSFTLNSSDSKVQGYSLSAEWHWPDDLDIDPVNGNITIPQTGVYRLTANVLGNQGNDTKEEWIELRLDTTGAGPQPADRSIISIMDVTTDKTSYRQVQASAMRGFYEGEVLSLWMWASSGLGTFTVLGCTFELKQVAEIEELVET